MDMLRMLSLFLQHALFKLQSYGVASEILCMTEYIGSGSLIRLYYVYTPKLLHE